MAGPEVFNFFSRWLKKNSYSVWVFGHWLGWQRETGSQWPQSRNRN
jgi:hypothetical protein